MEMWTLFGLFAVALIVAGLVSAGVVAKRADETRHGDEGAPGAHMRH